MPYIVMNAETGMCRPKQRHGGLVPFKRAGVWQRRTDAEGHVPSTCEYKPGVGMVYTPKPGWSVREVQLALVFGEEG